MWEVTAVAHVRRQRRSVPARHRRVAQALGVFLATLTLLRLVDPPRATDGRPRRRALRVRGRHDRHMTSAQRKKAKAKRGQRKQPQGPTESDAFEARPTANALSTDHLIDWNGAPAKGTLELPLFWDVALSGGTRTIKVIYAQCYHLVVACDIGKKLMGANENQDRLHVVSSMDGRNYTSVDTTTREGIQQASQLGFAQSNLTDLLMTRLLSESAASLFDTQFRGRMFSVFRHPIHRAVHMFHATKNTSAYARWSLDEYARSSYPESNGMVRSLTDTMTGRLSSANTKRAKELLSRKCLVGLAEEMEESVARFHRYFGLGDAVQLQCVREGLASTASHSHEGRELDVSRETWELLAEKNWADMRLYEYVQQLFMEQGKWLKENKKW